MTYLGRCAICKFCFLVLMIVTLLCTLFPGILILNEDNDTKSENAVKEYQYLVINSNKTSQGFFSTSNFDEPGYSYFTLTEQESFGTSPVFLVSEFGGDGYKCTGYCYCEPLDSEYRRAGSTVLSSATRKLISVFVIAASSTLAYKSAESIFERECKEKYSEVCEESSLVFVEDSTFFDDDRPVPEQCDLFEYIEQELEKEKYLSDKEKYFCTGKCLTKLSFKDPEANRLAREFDCGRFRTEGTIDVDCTKTKYRGDCRKFAVFQFRKILTQFCKSNSKITYYYHNPDLIYQKTKMKYTFQACVGTKWNFSPVKCTHVIS